MPTWYDILGVSPDATPDQIKAAWRDATDKFEPGTGVGQFRMFNDAADVLLDPEKRRAYDAEIAGAAPSAAAVPPLPPPPPPPPPPPAPAAPAAPATTEVLVSEVAPGGRVRQFVAYGRGLGSQLTSTFALAILAVLAVAAVVLAGFLAVNLHDRSGVVSAGQAAASVAERGVAAALAYDYRNLDASRDAAAKFMTEDYQKDYLKAFTLLQGTDEKPGPVVSTKTVVRAENVSSAVMDADNELVRVLVFADQQTTKNGRLQPILGNRMVVTMVLVDGTWLVDKINPLDAGF